MFTKSIPHCPASCLHTSTWTWLTSWFGPCCHWTDLIFTYYNVSLCIFLILRLRSWQDSIFFNKVFFFLRIGDWRLRQNSIWVWSHGKSFEACIDLLEETEYKCSIKRKRDEMKSQRGFSMSWRRRRSELHWETSPTNSIHPKNIVFDRVWQYRTMFSCRGLIAHLPSRSCMYASDSEWTVALSSFGTTILFTNWTKLRKRVIQWCPLSKWSFHGLWVAGDTSFLPHLQNIRLGFQNRSMCVKQGLCFASRRWRGYGSDPMPSFSIRSSKSR